MRITVCTLRNNVSVKHYSFDKRNGCTSNYTIALPESIFSLVASSRSEEMVRKYVNADLIERPKFFNKMRMCKSESMKDLIEKQKMGSNPFLTSSNLEGEMGSDHAKKDKSVASLIAL